MSGEERNVHAQPAIGTGKAHRAEVEFKIRGPGMAHHNLPGGRPSNLAPRIQAIEDAAAEFGEAATRLRVAQKLGRVDSEGKEASQFKADVRAAGGWEAIMARVQARE